MDHDCPWNWAGASSEKLLEIHKKLGDWEQRTWVQILNEDPSNQHSVELLSLCKEAEDRLREKKLDDFDSIFRFRFSGKERLWVIRNENVCYLLWWDPDHLVCPSAKSHT